jgi:hypothetical protein
MTSFTRSANGKYVVHNKSFEVLIGTRAQVWHETAYKTTGGLTKSDLLQNKNGRIVSRAKHSSAKKDNRLVRAGYGTQKGKFGFVKLNGKSKKSRKTSSSSKSKRGGSGMSSLSPSSFNGKGSGTSGVNLQFIAGNAA